MMVLISLAACGGSSAPHALVTASTSASATASPTPSESPVATPSVIPAPPIAPPSVAPPPPPNLTCAGQYQAEHPLLAAPIVAQGYGALAVLDVSDPLAPSLVCTVTNWPYANQPIQWLSRSEFLLVLPGRPNRILDVDVVRRSMTTFRDLNGDVGLARLSPDRAWLATMEYKTDGTSFARLYGPTGERTLAAYPVIGGHGGSIYGFGGPTIGFSPDGSLVVAVDYAANYVDSSVPNLQVFDLQGSRMLAAAKGLWAVWVKASLYYSDDRNVYRWTRGSDPVAILHASWIQPAGAPDGRNLAYLTYPGYKYNLDVLDTKSGSAKTLNATGQRIYPLFVTPNLLWASEMQVCDNCYGGSRSTGKVFAYDLSTGAESEVRLPDLLGPLMGASLSGGA